MPIKFTYMTKDNIFKIVDLPANLDKSKVVREPEKWYKNKDITQYKITVYNSQTNRYSEKSLYLNEKGEFYFKGNYYKSLTPISRKYYLKDLVEYNPVGVIEDKDFDVNVNLSTDEKKQGIKCKTQCSKLPSLYKLEYEDGKIQYVDTDRFDIYMISDGELTVEKIPKVENYVNSILPIKMPYIPSNEKLKICCSPLSLDKDGNVNIYDDSYDYNAISIDSVIIPNACPKSKPINKIIKYSFK